jgi:thiol-disulfide isomerase/thioredoxin
MIKSFFCLVFATSVWNISAQGFTIHTRITGFPEGTKFYLLDLDLQTIVDSASIKKNKFNFKGMAGDIPQFLRLYTTLEKEYYYCDVFMGNESVTITGDKKDFPYNMSYKGSPSQDLYQTLNRLTNPLQAYRDSLMGMAMVLSNDTTKDSKARFSSLINQVKPVDSTKEAIRIAFIRSHLNSYVGLKELNFLKSRFDKPELKKLYAAIEEPYKECLYARQLMAYIEVGDPVKKGDMAYDFEATDTSGKKYTLSGFKGKYVLLDFGYASCGACLLSLPELKKMDSVYTDKMVILSFNTDVSREVWHKSVIRDKPSWASLWDGKGNYSKPVLKYNVTGYPTFVLIDPSGKILWINSGYGDNMLSDLLSKYIK